MLTLHLTYCCKSLKSKLYIRACAVDCSITPYVLEISRLLRFVYSNSRCENGSARVECEVFFLLEDCDFGLSEGGFKEGGVE